MCLRLYGGLKQHVDIVVSTIQHDMKHMTKFVVKLLKKAISMSQTIIIIKLHIFRKIGKIYRMTPVVSSAKESELCTT
jgi:hypothetical protein